MSNRIVFWLSPVSLSSLYICSKIFFSIMYFLYSFVSFIAVFFLPNIKVISITSFLEFCFAEFFQTFVFIFQALLFLRPSNYQETYSFIYPNCIYRSLILQLYGIETKLSKRLLVCTRPFILQFSIWRCVSEHFPRNLFLASRLKTRRSRTFGNFVFKSIQNVKRNDYLLRASYKRLKLMGAHLNWHTGRLVLFSPWI